MRTLRRLPLLIVAADKYLLITPIENMDISAGRIGARSFLSVKGELGDTDFPKIALS